jgi:diguanylate cyclase (GGDEF)-like protein
MVTGSSTIAVNRTGASRALLALQMVVLAVGVLQFAFVPNVVEHPILAAATLAALAVTVLGVRLLPMQRWHQHIVDLTTMLAAITLLAIATGAARSALVPLYVVPLAGIATAVGRWWLVLLLAAVIAALSYLLGVLTPGIEVGSPEFGVWLVSSLAPGTTVALMLAALVERMHSADKRISDLSSTDSVTGLLNLRAFEEVLHQEHRKAERFRRNYAVAVVDIDNLSQIKETLGHEAGSLVLTAVASAITRSIRNSDVAARFGGDEFVVLCVEADPEIAAAIAQRIRNHVYSGTVSVANRLIRANVSVGVANFPGDHLYPKELMNLANQRMQQDRELRRDPEAIA